jgi:diguanylate cyclase (GGDEF)-like protein/PAS domain S-box-containing protein
VIERMNQPREVPVKKSSRGAAADRPPDMRAAVAATSRSILVTDATQPDNPITYANAAFSVLCGYSEAEVLGRNCRFLQGVDTDPVVVSEIRRALSSGVGIRREILNYRKDGRPFWNDLTIDPVRDAAGRLTWFVSVQSEADAVHLANQARVQAESKFDTIASNIPGFIFSRVMRTDGAIDLVYCSPSLSKMLGIAATDPLHSYYDHIHPDDRDALFAAIRRSAANMSTFREEFRLISASGATHWLRSEAPPRRMKNGEIVWDGLAIEFSAEKHWQSEIANLVLRDPLTSLLNREAWREALTRQLDAGSREVRRSGLVFVDIEAFRKLNEKLGQRICDDILVEIAQRLATLAASVSGFAARIGGDEFAILVPDCASDDDLSHLARELSEALARPIQVGAQYLTIRTCIGATLYAGLGMPGDKDVVSELMAQAELALRWAKQAGGNSHIVYSEVQDDRFRNQAILARSLERAIEDDELELHYQPVVDLASGRILSAEALVRWNHPTLGMQRPDLFIPMAEESGLIMQLGRWVFNQAVRQWTLWQDAGLSPPPIAINVSGNQLIEPAFVNFVEDSLKNLQARAQNFEIELTEGQVIEASPQIMASLHALRNMGFVIVIDDFGSGHATFRYLRDFPVDKVKIDQVFVRKLVRNSSDALIIRAIISLARSMGIVFVAEGIETEMQRDFLQSEGCNIGQGFLFSMPLVAEDFAWMLANDVKLPIPARPALAEDSGEIRPEPGEGRRSR